MIKKKNNSNNDFSIILIIIALIICIIVLIGMFRENKEPTVNPPITNTLYRNPVFNYTDGTYIDGNFDDFDKRVFDNIEDYEEMMYAFTIEPTLTDSDFAKNDYLVIIAENDSCGGSIDSIKKIDTSSTSVRLDINIKVTCGPCPSEKYVYLIDYPKNTINKNTKVNTKYVTINKPNCNPNVDYKPIIYIYPEEKTNVSIKVGYPSKLTTTYPKYNNGWEVTAYKDGSLYDKNGKYYYALYWEGLNTVSNSIRDEGFIIKGSDSIEFLEEKLSILGLNDKERNEFIMYWLPKLEKNKYNYIYFESLEERNISMPLDINPKPDTLIRILMEYKPLNKPIKVKEQVLKQVKRKGYTVVEWGGTELNR